MKKTFYIITLLAVGIIAYLIGMYEATIYFAGCTAKTGTAEASNNSIVIEKNIEITQDRFIETESEEFKENYIDLRTVTEYSGTDISLILYTDDGNEYYLEIEHVRN